MEFAEVLWISKKLCLPGPCPAFSLEYRVGNRAFSLQDASKIIKMPLIGSEKLCCETRSWYSGWNRLSWTLKMNYSLTSSGYVRRISQGLCSAEKWFCCIPNERRLARLTHTYVLLKHVETYSEANITKSPMWRIPQKSWQDKKDNTSDNWRPQGRSAFVETTTCFCISWKQDIDKCNRHPKKPNVYNII